jgi:hypothetical protein
MNTHTPAPWIFGEPLPDENRIQIMKKDAPRPDDIAPTWVVANVNLCMGQESEANARLIAHAPDLLEALKHLAVWRGTGNADPCFCDASDIQPGFWGHHRHSTECQAARAAIANAEGDAK